MAWTREKGYDEPIALRLMCEPLQKVGNYDISQEDPAVFKQVDPEVPREWPDIPLPSFKAQAEAAIAAATRSKTQPRPQPELAPKSNLVKELLEIHRSYVDVLLSMGVDPLKEYQEKKAENILSGVKPGDTKCKVLREEVFQHSEVEKSHKEASYREDSLLLWGMPPVLWRFAEPKGTLEETSARR